MEIENIKCRWRFAGTVYSKQWDNSGFSLLEVIVVLLILGVIGAFSSMILGDMVRNYQWANDNAHLTQKAQSAITRIAVELSYAEAVSVPDSHTITYSAFYPEEDYSVVNTISYSGDELVMDVSGTDDRLTLANLVSGFHVAMAEDSNHLLIIELRLTGANEKEQVFETSAAIP